MVKVTTAKISQEWGWTGIDHRQALNNHDVKASLKGIKNYNIEASGLLRVFLG